MKIVIAITVLGFGFLLYMVGQSNQKAFNECLAQNHTEDFCFKYTMQ
jgi:hypothetical protein